MEYSIINKLPVQKINLTASSSFPLMGAALRQQFASFAGIKMGQLNNLDPVCVEHKNAKKYVFHFMYHSVEKAEAIHAWCVNEGMSSWSSDDDLTNPKMLKWTNIKVHRVHRVNPSKDSMTMPQDFVCFRASDTRRITLFKLFFGGAQ